LSFASEIVFEMISIVSRLAMESPMPTLKPRFTSQ
jgi:hypothetical protein